jgi:hypothetical protein
MMTYSKPITREYPSCLLFMIDQSASMSESFAGTTMRKDQAVAQIVNHLIDVIGLKCTKGDTVRHYFDVGIIKYNHEAVSQFFDEASRPDFQSINWIYENPVNLDEVITGHDPQWIVPKSEGVTAMHSAFSLAKNMLERWIKGHPNSYPPTVFHISDGDYTDQDPTALAEEIKALKTENGQVLVYNISITKIKQTGIVFPDSIDNLPDKYGIMLFKMSSVIPETIKEKIYALTKLNLEPQARAFVYNADPTLLAQCLDIGTPLNMINE